MEVISLREQEAAMDRVSDYLQSPGGNPAKLKGASTSSEEMPDPLDFDDGQDDDSEEEYSEAMDEYKAATGFRHRYQQLRNN